jgi:hypothetical protein
MRLRLQRQQLLLSALQLARAHMRLRLQHQQLL